ncbi:lipoyl(octanoyl) transferase LipB [Sporichthya sp.]|uniref:lipoyl(octanoyl) transferase LipB n=1 Tax=Sporichthya sp. TaxID=65475 RepID=UPI00180C18DD|nr:lipoyl(octanoyl) transferase LipB [Sporichthya sp.]MBA3743794.1 lipoyl(octanoyl) transferase LipB [Sporichthya sp.]
MSELRFLHAFGGTPVPYGPAWDLQRDLHHARASDAISDTVILLEHEPVFTAGKRTEAKDRPWDGTPVVEVDRGGKITWHGPGQLTGYPIVKLPDGVYVVDYVRKLEVAIIAVFADLGLEATRVAGRSGVWVPGSPERKVAAIGIRVAKGVTMHGFAINCDCELDWFARIVPCGISDAAVTTLSLELGRTVTVAEVVPLVERRLAEAFGASAVTQAPLQLPSTAMGGAA